MTGLTDKEQPMIGAIVLAGESTAWACLTRVGGVYLHTEGTSQDGFIGQGAVQLSKSPFAGMSVCLALLPASFLALLALRAVSDAVQLFQANETRGVRVQNVLAEGMVGIQLQPSLSPANGSQLPSSRASAFLLKSLAKSGVMVGFATNLLTGIELRTVGSGGNRRQIALAYIYSHHLPKLLWDGVWCLNFQTHQQSKALLALIIPEFGGSYRRALLQECHVLLVALIGHDDATSKRQDADVVIWLQGIIAPKVVDQRGRDVLGRLVQPFVALLGIASSPRRRILARFGPECLIGAAHLARDIAGHLGRQAKLSAKVSIRFALQAPLIADFSMREGMETHPVQGITIRQLGRSQCVKLVRRQREF